MKKKNEYIMEQAYCTTEDVPIVSLIDTNSQNGVDALEDSIVLRGKAIERIRVYLDTQDRRFSQLQPGHTEIMRLRLSKYDVSADDSGREKGLSLYYLGLKYERLRKIDGEQRRFVRKVRIPMLQFRDMQEFLSESITPDFDYLEGISKSLSVVCQGREHPERWHEKREYIKRVIDKQEIIPIAATQYRRWSKGYGRGKRMTLDKRLVFRDMLGLTEHLRDIEKMFGILEQVPGHEVSKTIIEFKGPFSEDSAFIRHLRESLRLERYGTKFQEAMDILKCEHVIRHK